MALKAYYHELFPSDWKGRLMFLFPVVLKYLFPVVRNTSSGTQEERHAYDPDR